MKKLLPPDPENMNEDRAKWAMTAVAVFQERTRTNLEDALSDLLCDLMHLADRRETFHSPADDPDYMIEEFEAAYFLFFRTLRGLHCSVIFAWRTVICLPNVLTCGD
jgi:hypothetical protein